MYDDINPRSALRSLFGYDNFRPNQENIVNAIIEGRDALAVLTTGAGKSICYQIPAVCLPGTAVVVSPLISLMKDQVDVLNAKNIKSGFINSSQDGDSSMATLSELARGELKVLYISPEKLQSNEFRTLLKSINVSFFAVDEAHCISTWGRDFRLSYRRIGEAIDDISSAKGYRIPRSALTATATNEIRNDISSVLRLSDNCFKFVGKFDRPNIEFDFRESKSKFNDTIEILKNAKGGPTIIYVATVKECNSLYKILKANESEVGASVSRYNGKMKPQDRDSSQSDFLSGKTLVMVATNAFGMGIDKSDVRNIIHYQMPGSVENYFQEAGRAGRDGKPSKAYLLFNEKDKNLQDFFISSSYPSINTIDGVTDTLRSFEPGVAMHITASDLADISPVHITNLNQVNSIIKMLDDIGFLRILDKDPGDQTDGLTFSIENPNVGIDYQSYGEKKKEAIENLAAMSRLCKTKLCRRRFVIKHFGESNEVSNCGNCDNCRQQQLTIDEQENAINPEIVLSVLGAIRDTGESYEAKRIVDILSGVRTSAIERRGYDSIPSFGSMKEFTIPKIQRTIVAIKKAKLIDISSSSSSNALLVTGKGNELINKEASLEGDKKNADRLTPSIREKTPYDSYFSESLYRAISELRNTLSQELEKPEFMILSNREMKMIASRPPETPSDLIRLGIPSRKVELIGERILTVVDLSDERKYSSQHDIDI